MDELPQVDGWSVRFAVFPSEELPALFGVQEESAESWLAVRRSAIWPAINALDIAELKIQSALAQIGQAFRSRPETSRKAARAVLLLALLNHDSACEIDAALDSVLEVRSRLDADPDFAAALLGRPELASFYAKPLFQGDGLVASIDQHLEHANITAISVLALEAIANDMVAASSRPLMIVTKNQATHPSRPQRGPSPMRLVS